MLVWHGHSMLSFQKCLFFFFFSTSGFVWAQHNHTNIHSIKVERLNCSAKSVTVVETSVRFINVVFINHIFMIIFAIFAVQNNHLIFGSRKYIHIKEYADRKSILSIHRMVLCMAGEFVCYKIHSNSHALDFINVKLHFYNFLRNIF